MGYTTDFEGRFEVTPPLSANHSAYLDAFATTRRMRRNPKTTVQRDDRLREAWCKWVPTEDGCAIEWNGAEKFYDYVEWLEYLIEHFLGPWGYLLNGTVSWQGEDGDDRGRLHVTDNTVTTQRPRLTWD